MGSIKNIAISKNLLRVFIKYLLDYSDNASAFTIISSTGQELIFPYFAVRNGIKI
jgi:hypothetical protein